eukprot:GCRY01003129.1.p1 GENE.GCRY01003129.1~~GCRY01003129.1.p1  ORF type:complete len:367 (-),score=72.82 GCRY01003129.1:206-1306(-)
MSTTENLSRRELLDLWRRERAEKKDKKSRAPLAPLNPNHVNQARCDSKGSHPVLSQAKAKKAIEFCDKQIQTSSALNADLRKEIGQLKSENEKYIAAISEQSKELAQYKETLDNKIDENAQLLEVVIQESEKTVQLEDDKEELLKQLSEVHQVTLDLQRQNNAIQTKIISDDATCAELRAQNEQLREHLKLVQCEKAQILEKFLQSESAVKEFSFLYSVTKEDLESSKNEFKRLRDEFTACEAEKQQLSKRIKLDEDAIQELLLSLKQCKTELAAANFAHELNLLRSQEFEESESRLLDEICSLKQVHLQESSQLNESILKMKEEMLANLQKAVGKAHEYKALSQSHEERVGKLEALLSSNGIDFD